MVSWGFETAVRKLSCYTRFITAKVILITVQNRDNRMRDRMTTVSTQTKTRFKCMSGMKQARIGRLKTHQEAKDIIFYSGYCFVMCGSASV